MLVKIETTNNGFVWVNPNYVTDIDTFVSVTPEMKKTVCRIVTVSHGGERPNRVITHEPMEALAARLNASMT